MKRIGALFCLIIITMTLLVPASFAADSSNSGNTDSARFTIESSTPEDGATGVSVENLSVKIYFSKEMLPESKSIRQANAKQFKLTNAKGKEIPIRVYYSHKERKDGLMMVVSDIVDTDIQIQGNTEYTLTIGEDLQATDGTTLGHEETIEFRTLDQSRSTMVYTIMMIVMIVGMIFFSMRSAKKAMEKENDQKQKKDTVNPYKEAKRTGKSVEEIVEKDKKKKAKQAEDMAQMIAHLLLLSRADQGRQQLTKEMLNLSELTEIVAQEQQLLAEERKIRVYMEIEPEIYALADESFYIRMLVNLISNGIYYNREGGYVKVILRHTETEVQGIIEDNGTGISEEALPHIWERFYREDTSRSDSSHSGLGLSMVKWIVDAHGGTIRAESRVGEGSRFFFILPKEKK